MLHAGQAKILRAATRFSVVACGRRFGKTALGLALAACGAPHAQGGALQGLPVGWFAPSYKLLDESWRAARRFLRGYVARVDSQQKRLELTTGGALDFWTLEDVDAGRGRKYALAIVDEAAMARNLQEVWEQSLRATLTDYSGAAWFLSTPKGRNYFWRLYQDGLAVAKPEWSAHQAPSSDNPHIPAAEIEAARQSLPERVFAQEYLAQFLDDAGGVFRRVNDAVRPHLSADPHHARDAGDGRAYVIGVDWGRHEDYTVLVVLDARTGEVVAVDRFTQIEYAIQLSRLRAIHERFPRAPIYAESNSMGGPLVEALGSMGLPVRAFQTTSASKAQAIEALGLALERGELGLPAVPWLIDELIAYEAERMPSGLLRYSAPPGGHDDGVMALAIAWHAAHGAPSKPAGLSVQGL